MQLRLSRPIHLTYCTNMHPAESWAQTWDNLDAYTMKIRKRIAPGRPFGIGLWLSDRASTELTQSDELAGFKQYLADRNCYVFTLNGFPFGRFHGLRVKEKVFRPDWTQDDRLLHSCRLAEILAELLPPGFEGSISTVPCSFGPWIDDHNCVRQMIDNLAECAYRFEQISEGMRASVTLALEPEPLGYLETADDLIRFFEEGMRRRGVEYLGKKHRLNEEQSNSILNRRLGMCYDTCHMALIYGEPREIMGKLDQAGISIFKFQISSALKFRPTPDTLDQLSRFDDEVYLHQVFALQSDGAIRRYRDIDVALAERKDLLKAEELRVHCHVPLTLTEHRGLASTSSHIDDLLHELKDTNRVGHFELETYTWNVLPADLRSADLVDDVVAEFRWFIDRLGTIERQESLSDAS